MTIVGSGIGVDGETRRPGLDGEVVPDAEVELGVWGVALGVWVETGLPAVEVQALAVTVANPTATIKGASLGELTPCLSTAEREFGFCQAKRAT